MTRQIRSLVAIAGIVGLVFTAPRALSALQGDVLTTEALKFDVAAVRRSFSDDPPTSRFPLGNGDAYLPGGVFVARNQPLTVYLRFAYETSDMEAVPNWATGQFFNVDARASSGASKDDMRVMMRALLADRFKLRVVSEMRRRPVLTLSLARRGQWGSRLAKNNDGVCSSPPGSALVGIPCGSLGPAASDAADRVRLAGRNVTLDRFAVYVSNNPVTGIDRPVLNRTGITAPVDLTV